MSTRFQDSTFTFPHGTIFAIGQFKYPYFRKGLRFFNQTYRGSIYSKYLFLYDLQDYGYLLWISNMLKNKYLIKRVIRPGSLATYYRCSLLIYFPQVT